MNSTQAEGRSCQSFRLHLKQNGIGKENVTPFEIWHGKKPDISNLRVFGSPAYVLIPDAERKKLDPKAIRGLYVGECENQKGSRIFIESTGRTIVSRHVKAYENSSVGEQTTDANTQTALEPTENDNCTQLDSNSAQTLHHNPAELISTENKTTIRKRKKNTEPVRKSKRGLIPRKLWSMDAEKAMPTTTPSSCSSTTLALQASYSTNQKAIKKPYSQQKATYGKLQLTMK